MALDKLMIGLMVFSAIMFGGLFLIGDMNNQYDDVSISTSKFGAVNGSINELYNISQGMKDDVYGGETDIENTENSMFKGAFAGIKLFWDTTRVSGSIINAAAIELGVPSYFIVVAMAVLAAFIIYGLILLILRIRG